MSALARVFDDFLIGQRLLSVEPFGIMYGLKRSLHLLYAMALLRSESWGMTFLALQ